MSQPAVATTPPPSELRFPFNLRPLMGLWNGLFLQAGPVAAVAVIILGGRYAIRPLFRLVGGVRTPEVFTATALLVVTGAAALAHFAGLPASLGAFAAGVILSESEYRHELQADVEPFEGLLLGFFFISVGMSANIALAVADVAKLDRHPARPANQQWLVIKKIHVGRTSLHEEENDTFGFGGKVRGTGCQRVGGVGFSEQL